MMLRLGMVRTVVLSSPEAAREALKTHNVDCSGRSPSAGPRLLSYGYKDVIFSPYSDYVQEMRKLFILELLSKRRVQAACYARDAQVEKLVNNLTSIRTKPVPVPDYISATLDGIFGSFVLGGNRAAEKFKGQLVPVMNEAVDMLSSFSAEDFFANATGSLFDHVTGIKARRHRIFKKLDGFFEQVIEHYVNEDPTRKKLDDNCGSALLEELIDLWKKHNKITKDHVKAILMVIIIIAFVVEDASCNSFSERKELIFGSSSCATSSQIYFSHVNTYVSGHFRCWQ
uniref:Uncharacterized protein n=1 Tax=Triticum urartu TaxID=4572 RepID=A0A8R7P8X8_TRIUA